MDKNENEITSVLRELQELALPTDGQKAEMLGRIMSEGNGERSGLKKIKNFICVYPWRLAIALSAVQAAVLTLICGTQYTNLFLNFFGG